MTSSTANPGPLRLYGKSWTHVYRDPDTGHSRQKRFGSDYDRALERYVRWLADGGPAAVPKAELTIGGLIDRYIRHARGVYTDGGQVKSVITPATDALRAGFGDLPLSRFGPKAFKSVRRTMIEGGLARSTINKRCDAIQLMFQWATSEELIGGERLTELQSVRRLRRGEDGVAESTGPRGTDVAKIAQVVNRFRRTRRENAYMIRFHYHTLGRPQDVCRIERAHIVDRDDPDCWIAVLPEHKTKYLGKVRILAIPRRAIAVLRRMPLRTGPVFRTRYGAPFTTDGYSSTIAKASSLLGQKPWRANRLRHFMDDEIDLEVARALLGHNSTAVTRAYAEAAKETVREAGKEAAKTRRTARARRA